MSCSHKESSLCAGAAPALGTAPDTLPPALPQVRLMQESVRRIIEAEEARMGKAGSTPALIHELRVGKEEREAGWVRRRKARWYSSVSTANQARCCWCSGEVSLGFSFWCLSLRGVH